MRRSEGDALGKILAGRLSEIAELTARARGHAGGEETEAIKARLAERSPNRWTVRSASTPTGSSGSDLLASKADIREELDRLVAHVAQGKKLISSGGRSAASSTSWPRTQSLIQHGCAPRPTSGAANIGLDLKAVVEQFREQVQNLE